MTTLYRKYRPQNFSSFAGQEVVAETIQNEIKTDQLAHAYLFAGPRGVGKTTMARLLAKAVNCEKRKKGEAEPCNECSSCTEINAGHHIDVIEIDAASQTGVDNVRENIIENARFKPTKAKTKVFIVDEVHMLSTSAFNALLKTLEEPPAQTMFILATTELHKLPATVISRCQRFTFKKIPYEIMKQRLETLAKQEEVKLDEAVIDRIIHKSEGGLRDAESLLGQVLSLGKKKITVEDAEMVLPASNVQGMIEFIVAAVNGKPQEAFLLLQKQILEGANLDQCATDLIELLRTALVAQTTGTVPATDYSQTVLKELTTLGKDLSAPRMIYLIDQAIKRKNDMRFSPIPELPLELWAVEAGIEPSAPVTPAEKKTATVEPTAIKKPAAEAPKAHITATATTTTPAMPAATETTVAPQKKSSEPTKTTLDQIREKWTAIVNKVDESAHSLTFILSMCSLNALSGNTLVASVPYAIHKQKLDENKNKKVIEQALANTFSEPLFFACDVATVASEDLDSLAAEFNGEVVG